MKALLTKYGVFIYLIVTTVSLRAQGLVPDYVIVQHAGSIGYLSAGIGYHLFKKDKGSLDFQYGEVPESKGGPLHILTAKFNYRPFDFNLGKSAVVYPLNPGVFFSYHIDKDLSFAFDQQQYGKSYYGWSEALRSYLSISNEVRFNVGEKLKSVTVYSEFNASDLYLASFFYKNNRDYMKPQDFIKLGLGVKVGF
jgi:hypothetical protein